MLSFRREGSTGPLLILLHWLGGGAQTWQEVSDRLAARGVQCAALDLPGFGASASAAGYAIGAMADQVIETIHALRTETDGPWLLAGHSMGGTVAAVIARRALDGEPGLEHLRGLILVSASPPGPEPMPEAKRSEMLTTLGQPSGDPKQDRGFATKFVDDNTGKLRLLEAVRDRAIEGVLGMDRNALRAWLEHGSHEDWRAHIGTLPLPTLIFAGTEDGALGPDAQRQHTLPHFPQSELILLEATGHLAPLERPSELIEHLTQFIAGLGLTLATPDARPGERTEALMHSVNTAPQTRSAMQDRLSRAQNWNTVPQVFSAAEFRTLRALAQAILPGAGFDLAAAIDAQLAANKGDGWRYAVLPPDPEAWHRGLLSLDLAARHAHGVPFLSLHPDQQHAVLTHLAEGTLEVHRPDTPPTAQDPAVLLSAEALKQWFEDARAELTRFYIADPRTMNRIAYTGFADELGFTQIYLGQGEEPVR